jgi:ABC-type lipoprotein export system ATPase subunit
MLIEAQDLWKIYPRSQEPVEALRGVDMHLPEGAFAVVVGPSGGGKSTLLHLLGGMDRPSKGQLTVCGVDLIHSNENALNRFRQQQVGFIFQFYNLIPSLDAVENVSLPLIARGWQRRQALQRARELLVQSGLEKRLRHKPAELSGGEQQRLAITRAIAGQARLILADEPTGDLDSTSAAAIMQWMADLNHNLGVTLVIATHNPDFCHYASQVYELRDGCLRKSDSVRHGP